MRMFYWRSEALKQYGSGWLIACALDADEARAKLRDAAAATLKDYRSWLDEDDEFDAEDIAKFKAQVEADLSREPSEPSGHMALCIWGSE